MRKLYICECPYVLYKTLIERMGDEENSYSLILSDVVTDMKPMVPVLRQSGLFERVEFFPSEPYRDYYDLYYFHIPASTVKRALVLLKNYLLMVSRQKEFKEIAFPFDLDFTQYDKIICTDLPYIINGYLSMNHMEYAITEHARYVYRKSFWTMQYSAFYAALDLLDNMHILTGMRTSSRFCKEIIVNDAMELTRVIRRKKVTCWNVGEHIEALDAQQKDQIFQLYAEAYGLKIDKDVTYDLLLTNPLYYASCLPSEEIQIQFYKDIIRDRFSHPVLIKPHPRDTVDYRKFFPECTVIDQEIASEVLNFSQNLRLGTVLTVYSTSGGAFQEKAEELVVMEDYHTPISQMESLKAYR